METQTLLEEIETKLETLLRTRYSMAIPEWDTTIYWLPLTHREDYEIRAKASDDRPTIPSDLNDLLKKFPQSPKIPPDRIYILYCEAIIRKAQDEHGNKLFKIEEEARNVLLTRTDATIVERIGKSILDPSEEQKLIA